MRRKAELFVKSPPLQLTLRKMHAAFTTPKVLIGLLIVAVVLGVSGPFQTFEAFALPTRLLYWLAVSALTFAAGFFAGDLTEALLDNRLKEWSRFMLSSLATAFAVTATVYLINTVGFWADPIMASEVLALSAYVVVISFAVSVAFKMFGPKSSVPNSSPLILERLPLHLRGRLISLSVQDHYTEVRTSKGAHLVLIRLSDAIQESGDGLQIHRSHWVATRAIAKVERRAGKVALTTVDGTVLPVSRSFLGAVKAAGLLP